MQQLAGILNISGVRSSTNEKSFDELRENSDFKRALNSEQRKVVESQKEANSAEKSEAAASTNRNPGDRDEVSQSDKSQQTKSDAKSGGSVDDDSSTTADCGDPASEHSQQPAEVDVHEGDSGELAIVADKAEDLEVLPESDNDMAVVVMPDTAAANPDSKRLSLAGGVQQQSDLSQSHQHVLSRFKLNPSALADQAVAQQDADNVLQSELKDSTTTSNGLLKGTTALQGQNQIFQLDHGKFKSGKGFSLATDLSLKSDIPDLQTAQDNTPVPVANNHSSATFNLSATNSRVEMPVNITFGKPQWAGMVAERTAMMAAQNISSADLQLDPPELGPLQVKVHVHHDQISVSFVASNANVRDALDQTAMRLRDLCEQQGMNLADVNVSDQSQQDSAFSQGNSGTGESGSRQEGRGGDQDMASDDAAAQTTVQIQAGWGVDYYA